MPTELPAEPSPTREAEVSGSLRAPTLRRVLDAQLCSGCGLCASLAGAAISIRSLEPGFNRPVQLAPIPKEVDRLIAATCPGSVVEPWASAPREHPYWGPYHRLATGFADDPRVRFNGSSGGVVTALAAHALRTGLVDKVVCVQADPADPAGNVTVVAADPETVIAGAGSRYVASSPLQGIEQLLADGLRYAFIGKPCDVSALRRLARIDPRVDAQIPLMLAFYCAGIPSRRVVARLLTAMGIEPGALASFRYRGEGWPGRAKAVTRSGQSADMSYADSWGGHLSKEVQFRCKVCPDAVGGVADLACADAWYGGETGYPTFEELDGRSLVMSRTERGEAFLKQAESAGVLTLEPLPIDDIDLMQPGQARRKRLVLGRLVAMRAVLLPTPGVAGLQVAAAARRAGVGEQVKNFLGSVRRSLRLRAGAKV